MASLQPTAAGGVRTTSAGADRQFHAGDLSVVARLPVTNPHWPAAGRGHRGDSGEGYWGRAERGQNVPAAPPAPEQAQGPQHAVAHSRRTAPTAVTQPRLAVSP